MPVSGHVPQQIRSSHRIFLGVCCVSGLLILVLQNYQVTYSWHANLISNLPKFIFTKIDPVSTKIVKIHIWNPPKSPINNSSLGRISKLMDQLNQENGKVCRELDANNADGNTEPIYCQFSLDPTTVLEADAVSYYMFNGGHRM